MATSIIYQFVLILNFGTLMLFLADIALLDLVFPRTKNLKEYYKGVTIVLLLLFALCLVCYSTYTLSIFYKMYV